MIKQIIKRRTFKEAFADVLKLSREELDSRSIDPFIKEAFSVFEEMDFSQIEIDDSINHNHYGDFYSPDKAIMFDYNNYFIEKKMLLNVSLVKEFYAQVLIDRFNDQHNSLTSFSKNENEVEQWLLAA